jgi:hypothetical protein
MPQSKFHGWIKSLIRWKYKNYVNDLEAWSCTDLRRTGSFEWAVWTGFWSLAALLNVYRGYLSNVSRLLSSLNNCENSRKLCPLVRYFVKDPPKSSQKIDANLTPINNYCHSFWLKKIKVFSENKLFIYFNDIGSLVHALFKDLWLKVICMILLAIKYHATFSYWKCRDALYWLFTKTCGSSGNCSFSELVVGAEVNVLCLLYLLYKQRW